MAITLHQFHGAALEPWLDKLGELRIAVFREFPYLYDGTLEYERNYLSTYLKSDKSLIVLALDDNENVVGATTCLPLSDESPEFQAPFAQLGYSIDDVCYFGESILLPAYRGQGIGKAFFTRREAHAQKLGTKWTTFCAVDRADDHVLKPADYRPLADFWKSQGYVLHPELQAVFDWKEIGGETEIPHTLTFWMKSWRE